MRRLGSNALANLFGALLPAFVFLWSVPLTLHYLGEQGYGVFALLTAIVGYFAVIDLNVTSGALKYVSEFHARDEHREVNEVVSLGLGLYLLIGVLGMLAMLALGPWLIEEVFRIPEAHMETSVLAIRFAAVGFLFSQLQVFLQGMPQALQRYDVSGGLESVFGITMPVATVATLAAGYGLDAVMLVRAVVSGINVLVLAMFVRRLLPRFSFVRPSGSVTRKVASFSGFAYLSRLTTITYAQGDKLILGALTGTAAVSQYVIPQSFVSRLFSMSYRIGAVVMPAASALAAQGDHAEVRRVGLAVARYTVYLNACLALFLVYLAGTLLHLWLKGGVSAVANDILILLTLGALANSLTNIPSLVNDGLGHAKVSGVFALTHAVLGLSCAAAAIAAFGVIGAAACQVGVSVVMALVFNGFVMNRTVPWGARDYWCTVLRPSAPVLLLCIGGAAFGGERRSLTVAAAFAIGGGALLALYGFWVVLLSEHRTLVIARLSRLLRRR